MNKFLKKLKKYFVPGQENDFKPNFLRHESMLFVLLFVLLVELGFLVQIFVVFDKTKFLAQVLPAVLTSLTNEQRVENNAPKLAVNDLLTKAATLKANDMATKGYFAHTSPEGKTPWYWFDQVGYNYAYAGENLAVNFFESQDVAIAWMNSPTHRANIIKKDYTEIGIGIATGIYEGRDTVFVAQLFGTPLKNIAPVKTPIKTIVKPTATKPIVNRKKIESTSKPGTKITNTTTPIKNPEPLITKVLAEETSSQVAVIQNKIKNFSLKSFLENISTSPRQSVTYVLELLALVIFLSIILMRLIAYEQRHSVGISRGLAVIAIIGFILFLNFKISSKTTLVLLNDTLEASTIQSGY